MLRSLKSLARLSHGSWHTLKNFIYRGSNYVEHVKNGKAKTLVYLSLLNGVGWLFSAGRYIKPIFWNNSLILNKFISNYHYSWVAWSHFTVHVSTSLHVFNNRSEMVVQGWLLRYGCSLFRYGCSQMAIQGWLFSDGCSMFIYDCSRMALQIWLLRYGCSDMAVQWWLFRDGSSDMAAHRWLYRDGCSRMPVQGWLFRHGCSDMAVQIWLFEDVCSGMDVQIWLFRYGCSRMAVQV